MDLQSQEFSGVNIIKWHLHRIFDQLHRIFNLTQEKCSFTQDKNIIIPMSTSRNHSSASSEPEGSVKGLWLQTLKQQETLQRHSMSFGLLQHCLPSRTGIFYDLVFTQQNYTNSTSPGKEGARGATVQEACGSAALSSQKGYYLSGVNQGVHYHLQPGPKEVEELL